MFRHPLLGSDTHGLSHKKPAWAKCIKGSFFFFFKWAQKKMRLGRCPTFVIVNFSHIEVGITGENQYPVPFPLPYPSFNPSFGSSCP